MISSEVLDELVRRIVAAAQPRRIILFGSAARDQMGPGSDLDVLVIMPDGSHRRNTSSVIYLGLRRFAYPIDVVVATEADIREYGDSIGLVFRQALKEGKELYHAA